MRRLTRDEFIFKARKIHGNKYDYSKVDYINNSTDIIIICPEHGEFLQKPGSHLMGRGCNKCGKQKARLVITGKYKQNININIGDIFNNLTILERLENTKNGLSKFKCKCTCGNEKITTGVSLRNGSCKSCGCLHRNVMYDKRLGDAVYKILLRNIKSDCRYRNILFNLDLETIKEITNKNCTYCNREPYEKRCAYQRKNSKAEDNCLLLNGLDRVIPEKGYVKDNVVPCCKYCNRAKSDLSLKEFKNLINLIYKNYINEA